MDVIAFDLETTGTLSYVHSVIEIAAVKFKDQKPVEVFSTLVDPKKEIPLEATRINGITNDMVKGQPEIKDVLPEFANFCERMPLVAHNASFDFQFLDFNIKKLKTPSPKGRVYDTYSMARKLFPNLASYKLINLVSYFKIPQAKNYHRASDDAKCCGQLFYKLYEKLLTELKNPSDFKEQLNKLQALTTKKMIFSKPETFNHQFSLNI